MDSTKNSKDNLVEAIQALSRSNIEHKNEVKLLEYASKITTIMLEQSMITSHLSDMTNSLLKLYDMINEDLDKTQKLGFKKICYLLDELKDLVMNVSVLSANRVLVADSLTAIIAIKDFYYSNLDKEAIKSFLEKVYIVLQSKIYGVTKDDHALIVNNLPCFFITLDTICSSHRTFVNNRFPQSLLNTTQDISHDTDLFMENRQLEGFLADILLLIKHLECFVELNPITLDRLIDERDMLLSDYRSKLYLG